MSEADEKLNQVRWYAKSALNGFDTLDPEDAIGNAKADLAALLAYLEPRMTSHPAEAATRENGDLPPVEEIEQVQLVGCDPTVPAPPCYRVTVAGRCFDFDTKLEAKNLRKAIAEYAALSTHQQQGDSERFARLMAALELAGNRLHRCVLDHPVGSREFLERSDWTKDAREALFAAVASRSPQPDTVTEELRALLEWADEYCRTGKCPTYDTVEPARAALTAALNAKGK